MVSELFICLLDICLLLTLVCRYFTRLYHASCVEEQITHICKIIDQLAILTATVNNLIIT